MNEQLALINPDEHPNDEIIFFHIGRLKTHWNLLFKHIEENHPGFVNEWRFYKDGSSWLLKITQKKKTVFWISVLKKKFQMTFYFTDRAQELIDESSISGELKEQFKNAKYYNKIRPLTIDFSNKQDVEYAKTLIDIKLSVK